MKVKGIYTVWAREHYEQKYEVFAETEEEAARLFASGDGHYVDSTLEYIGTDKYELDSIAVDGYVLVRDGGTEIRFMRDLRSEDLEALGIEDGDLDDLVHSYASVKAATVNNQGVVQQIIFLGNNYCSLNEIVDALEDQEESDDETTD